ncbi:MAG TPA: DoxX family protein [Sphingobium sp.]|uniref:DoxX family protein n=1 Tax=Sphingobium sp. TaxID=1912891 RepID=UPI002ED5548A
MTEQPGKDADGTGRRLTRWLLAGAYAFAGYKHITAPAGFVAITPSWVPDPARIVFLTGCCEVAGAVGLLMPRRLIGWARPAAGVGLALYALCVWPANINHAVNDIPLGGVHLSWWYHGPRLIAQPVIIWVALWASSVIDWPFRRKASAPSSDPGTA